MTRLWSRYGDPRGTEARADFVALLGLSCLAMVLAIVAGNALEEASPLLGRARPDLVIPAAVVLFLAPALVAAAVRRFRALGRSSLMLVVVFLFAGLPGLLLLMLRRSRFTAPTPHRARLSPWVAGVTGLALACAAAVFLAGHPGPGDMIAGRVLSPAVELAADPRAAAAPMILPDPVPLSGRGASDFLDRLTHRGTR